LILLLVGLKCIVVMVFVIMGKILTRVRAIVGQLSFVEMVFVIQVRIGVFVRAIVNFSPRVGNMGVNLVKMNILARLIAIMDIVEILHVINLKIIGLANKIVGIVEIRIVGFPRIVILVQ
tara:strand:- start:213 stop:572 length:360 start_codon:yes stop_codon:yes gene_type:complete